MLGFEPCLKCFLMQLVWSIRGPSRSHTRSLSVSRYGILSGWPAAHALLLVMSGCLLLTAHVSSLGLSVQLLRTQYRRDPTVNHPFSSHIPHLLIW